MSDTTNDIDELLRYLDNDYWPGKHRALTALLAERNALRQENDSLRSRCNATGTL